MRWVALGVDYEMAGKDLIDSVKLSGEICRALGGQPPEGFNYELFLDENGQKISKSKGNGLTIDEWLRYAAPESLSLFMYREPKSAKRLYFDVIPRTVDEYQQFLDGYARQDPRQRLSNPVWHIHSGNPPKADMPVSFQMLLTLVSSSNAENAETLWGFIGRYRPGVTAQDASEARRDGGLRHPLFPRLRAAAQEIPPAERDRARRAHRPARRAGAVAGRRHAPRKSRTWSMRSAAASRSSTRRRKPRTASRACSLDWFNMLYQVLLGPGERPALRLVRGGLRLAEHRRHDRRRAGAHRRKIRPSPPDPARSRCDPAILELGGSGLRSGPPPFGTAKAMTIYDVSTKRRLSFWIGRAFIGNNLPKASMSAFATWIGWCSSSQSTTSLQGGVVSEPA